MHRIPKCGRVFVVLACVLAVGAAGYPARSVPPSKFADGVCSAMNDWIKSLKQGATQYQTELEGADATNLPAVRDSITAYLATTVSKTDRLTATLRTIGAPNTPKGKQVERGLLAAFAKVHRAFAVAQDMSRSVSTTDVEQFKTDAQGVDAQINSASEKFGHAFDALDKLDPNHALEKAFKRQAACRTLAA